MGKLLFAMLLLPLAALAAPEAAPAAAPVLATGGSGLAGQLTQTVLGLLAVVALIFGLAWLMRRVQQRRARARSST
jgi:flagellar protein FliO/FliZ